jgi:hypothetical protein
MITVMTIQTPERQARQSWSMTEAAGSTPSGSFATGFRCVHAQDDFSATCWGAMSSR